MAALERLAALKASGPITEAEFQSEKARFLDSSTGTATISVPPASWSQTTETHGRDG